MYVEGVVKYGGKSVTAKFLVDPCLPHTVLARDVWEPLGVKPIGEVGVALTDGSVVNRRVGEVTLELPGLGEKRVLVILGEPGDLNILGESTLEAFCLVFNPLTRGVKPCRPAPRRVQYIC